MAERHTPDAGHLIEAEQTLRDEVSTYRLANIVSAVDEHRGHDARAAAAVVAASEIRKAFVVPFARLLEREQRKIGGLESDLASAVQTAYNHGAEEWALRNYPGWADRLEAGKRQWLANAAKEAAR